MTSRLAKFERNKTDNSEEIIKSRLAYKMCTNYPAIKMRLGNGQKIKHLKFVFMCSLRRHNFKTAYFKATTYKN